MYSCQSSSQMISVTVIVSDIFCCGLKANRCSRVSLCADEMW